MTKPIYLPNDFDVATIGDDSRLPADALASLRELAWRKAKSDPIWFMEKFWWAMNPFTFRWERFVPRDYQREDIAVMTESKNLDRPRYKIVKARQIGWTTEAAAFAFHDLFFTENHKWLISSQGEDEAQGTLKDKVKQPYRRLPVWMRDYPSAPTVTDDNLEIFGFSNGSWIMSVPSTSSAARSNAVYGALVDEFAYVPDGDALLTALDPLCYGPMFVFSTAQGMGNPDHKLWMESQAPDSVWVGMFRPWHVVPERGPFYEDDEGRLTSKWYEREKRKFRGRENEFYQENPSTPEEAFARSGRTVIPMHLVEPYIEEPGWKIDLQTADLSTPFTAKSLEKLEPNEWAGEELWVWEPPSVLRDEKNRIVQMPNYVLAADVAEGLAHGDRSTIVVLNANTGETAATYRGYWEVEDFGRLIMWVARSYYIPLVGIERNNHGILPIDHMRRNNYLRLYRMAALAAFQKEDRTPRFGWLTTGGSKPKMVFDLIRHIKDEILAIRDARFMQEASTFIANGRGGFGAVEGQYDDLVIAFAIAVQLMMEVGAYPVIWHDDSPDRVTYHDLYELGKTPERDPMNEPIGARKSKVGTRAFTA